MYWLTKVKGRRSEDRADAILVMSILFVPFLFLVAGFSMDLTKSVYVKSQYQTMAQEATTAATRSINPNGSIASTAPQTVVSVYRERFNGEDTSGVNASNSGRYASQEGSYQVRNSVCQTVRLPDGSTKTAPYMEITLTGGRNDVDSVNGTSLSPVYTSEGYGAPVLKTGTVYDPGRRYYSIRAQVYDVAPNLMLGMFGRPCQQTASSVSSITFGSQADVYDYDANQNSGSLCPSSNLRWAGTNALAWDTMQNTNGYRITSNGPGGAGGTYTTTSTAFTGGDLNRYDASRTWYLEAKHSNTGGYVDCGSIIGVLPPDPTCPANTFAWTGTNSFTWNAITNANGYRITSTSTSGSAGGPYTTTSNAFSGGDLNRYDANRTWKLEARNTITGAYVACGTLKGQVAPAPVCPTGAFNWSSNTAIAWTGVTNATGYRVTSNKLPGVYATVGASTTYSNTSDSTRPITNKFEVGTTLTLQASNVAGAWTNCGTLNSTGPATPVCTGIAPYWDDYAGIAWNAAPYAVAYRVSSSKLAGVYSSNLTSPYYSNYPGNTDYVAGRPITDQNQVGATLTIQAQGSDGTWVNCGTINSQGIAPTCPTTWNASYTRLSTGTHSFGASWTPRTSGQPNGNQFRVVFVKGTSTYTGPLANESTGAAAATASAATYAGGEIVSLKLELLNNSTNPTYALNCGSKNVTVTAPPAPVCPSSIVMDDPQPGGTLNKRSTNFTWNSSTGTGTILQFSYSGQAATAPKSDGSYFRVVTGYGVWTVRAAPSTFGPWTTCSYTSSGGGGGI